MATVMVMKMEMEMVQRITDQGVWGQDIHAMENDLDQCRVWCKHRVGVLNVLSTTDLGAYMMYLFPPGPAAVCGRSSGIRRPLALNVPIHSHSARLPLELSSKHVAPCNLLEARSP